MTLTAAKFFTMFDQDIIGKSQLIQIQQSLKLQELVKERIEEMSPVNSASDDYDEFIILQALLGESEK